MFVTIHLTLLTPFPWRSFIFAVNSRKQFWGLEPDYGRWQYWNKQHSGKLGVYYLAHQVAKVASNCTVVKWGHNEGIEEGKNFVPKIYCYCPLNVMEKVPAEVKYPHSDWKYLQKVNDLRFWLKVPAESKCKMPSDFWWKKKF